MFFILFHLFFGRKRRLRCVSKYSIANSIYKWWQFHAQLPYWNVRRWLNNVEWNFELSKLRGEIYLYYISRTSSPLPQVLQQFPQAPHLPGQMFHPAPNSIISAFTAIKMSRKTNHSISCWHNQTLSPSNWILSAWKIIFSVFNNFLPPFSPELPLLSCKVKVAGICYTFNSKRFKL